MIRAAPLRPTWPVLALLALCMAPALAGGPRWRGSPFEGWTPTAGTWELRGDGLAQTATKSDCRVFAPLADWQDYALTLKARKLGGREGFLILFRVKDRGHFYWWNVAGWGNSRHAVETRPQRVFDSKPGRVETGRWYGIQVVVEGPRIRCYLDGKLVHDIQEPTYKAGGIGLGTWSTQAEYKDVAVTTLDGKRLFGAPPAELAANAIDALGSAAEALRPELDALRKASAKPDDPRWTALYRKASALRDRLREAEARLASIDLAEARTVLERLIESAPAMKPKAQQLLAQLDGHQTRLHALKAAVAKGQPIDLAQAADIVAFADHVLALRREAWVPRCPPVAFILRQPHTRHGTNATMHVRVHGRGSAIAVLDPSARLRAGPSSPDQKPRVIFEDPEGYVFDMSPSYDATKLVFAFKKKVREDSFHIYEIGADGTGLRQITRGPYHDFSPVCLPDGRICFNSTRVESFSLCQNFVACALYVVDADGSNLRRLEYNTLCDLTPFVMDDGTILFSRWEYQDKNIFCTEALWTINPDGSRLQLFYGNTLTVPNGLYGAKQIPGTRKVIAVGAAHHHRPLGSICIIDRSLGHENVAAIRNITPEVPYTPRVGAHWRETSWGPGDKLYPWSYTDPWPLAEDLFLVSYGGPMQGGPQRYRLYLMDDRGHKVELYDARTTSCFSPVPLRPRPVPHQVAGTLPEAKGEGRFFVVDVYQGLEDKGVQRGTVKQLRIMSQTPKKYNTEGPRYSDHYPAIGEGTYYVKWNYGSVPVYPDGSAYFTAPAGVELYFQALDAHGKEIRRMGTVTQITDGETQSCIGCHEPRNTAPPVGTEAWKLLARGPDPISPPPWGAGPVDFVQQVQPVLDKHCVKCHSGPTPPKGIDLSGDKTRLFSMAFETLVFTPALVARYHINPGPTGNFPPLATGSWVSRLTQKIEAKHSKVEMDPESRRRIYCWIDANVPYYGTWDMTRPHTLGGRDTWLERGNKPQPWFAEFQRAYAALGAPDPKAKGQRRKLPGVRHTDINLTHPAWSRVLTRHLAKSAGGLAPDDRALFKAKDAPRYLALLAALEKGKQALLARPRMDMPDAKPLPQERNFGKTF